MKNRRVMEKPLDLHEALKKLAVTTLLTIATTVITFHKKEQDT